MQFLQSNTSWKIPSRYKSGCGTGDHSQTAISTYSLLWKSATSKWRCAKKYTPLAKTDVIWRTDSITQWI